MIDILLSISLFASVVILHAKVCRSKPCNNLYAKDFIIIASCCWLLLLYALTHIHVEGGRFILSALVLYILLIPVYLIVYVSMVLISPSKSLLFLLNNEKGLTLEELMNGFKGDALIDSRFEELLASGCMIEKSGKYVLTFNGQMIFQVLMAYQWLSGRQGEG